MLYTALFFPGLTSCNKTAFSAAVVKHKQSVNYCINNSNEEGMIHFGELLTMNKIREFKTHPSGIRWQAKRVEAGARKGSQGFFKTPYVRQNGSVTIKEIGEPIWTIHSGLPPAVVKIKKIKKETETNKRKRIQAEVLLIERKEQKEKNVLAKKIRLQEKKLDDEKREKEKKEAVAAALKQERERRKKKRQEKEKGKTKVVQVANDVSDVSSSEDEEEEEEDVVDHKNIKKSVLSSSSSAASSSSSSVSSLLKNQTYVVELKNEIKTLKNQLNVYQNDIETSNLKRKCLEKAVLMWQHKASQKESDTQKSDMIKKNHEMKGLKKELKLWRNGTKRFEE